VAGDHHGSYTCSITWGAAVSACSSSPIAVLAQCSTAVPELANAATVDPASEDLPVSVRLRLGVGRRAWLARHAGAVYQAFTSNALSHTSRAAAREV
jgi:hypothetical protein